MEKKVLALMISILLYCPFVFAQDMVIDGNGNVGIGTTSPTEKLSVDGIIESTGGGIKFPDGSVQITASSGGGGSGGSYVKVAIVAQGGGDYTDPVTAMNNIATWCGTPSSTNPCLLKVMPGVYNVGSMSLQMVPYVDMEGSGENTTKITGNFSDDWRSGVVNGTDYSEIRFLTVENTGGGTYAVAIAMENVSPKITNVTVNASGSDENVGIICQTNCSMTLTNITALATGGTLAIGVYMDNYSSSRITNVKATASGAVRNIGFDLNTYSDPTMINITAIATGGTKTQALLIQNRSFPTMSNVTAIASNATDENYAVYSIQASSPVMTNIIADASGGASNYGVYNTQFGINGGTIRIDNSVIKGTTNAIHIDTTYGALIGNTRLGGSVTGPGTATCAGVYDDSYTFFANSCP